MGLDLFNVLQELTQAVGLASGEGPVAAVAEKLWQPLADETWRDGVGNLYARKGGQGGPAIVAAAHLDQIGFLVSKVEADGFLRFLPVGGWDRRALPGQEVTIQTKNGPVTGVIGTKPPHLTTPEERQKTPKLEDLFIDTGLTEHAIEVGDQITVKGPLARLLNGRVAGTALDNRAGVAALTVALNELQGLTSWADFVAVGTVQEESGHYLGGSTAPYRLEPAVALAVDVTFGIHRGSQEDSLPLGGGPVLMLGPNVHPHVAKLLEQVARGLGLPYELEVTGGPSGTDAWAMQVVGGGVPTGVVSIPLRYMHTPTEVVQLSDIEQVGRLVAHFVAAITPEWLEGLKWS